MNRAGQQDVVFLAAKRTPFGTFGGALKDLSATDLAVHAAKAAMAQAGAPPADYGHVVVGNVAQTSPDAIYLARHVGLRAGLPEGVPALTVNRLCGSGFEAVIEAARLVHTGEAELVLAGGTESMSQAPLVLRGTRFGHAFGKTPQLEDMLWSALTDTYAGMPMALTAEKLAETHRIGQDAVDELAVASQRRWAAADEAGRFREELAPVELPSRKGTVRFEKDEHPRPGTTLEGLRKLPKVFKADGVIHAGAASGIADGAGMLVVASRAYAERRGLRPLGRLVNWGHAGVDPTVMGIGPVPAVRNALARAGATLSDLDLFEVNEAFAPQYLAVEQELGLPRDRTNVDGGAIALGHPLAASGARITMHLLYELRRRGARAGIGSACIGGGQGVAVILEPL
ncbi:acetyl-CoA C-acetyltransferase [Anaeromyxobacter dehalogenans]|uniref:Acetyl-CoA acetyltransferase n=1 Tax=Anaeromyxobacter dehalogenans (strain 2CP-C) TaxID=290397 RepID=Q2IM05_ANADE|nr:acetyl-CoA C-acetyltransferase [Anaeromyxobacter dehalogenans]ABC79840.1 acetyl-CoA acetyltransferase [Anaeromyxobacter dehalogenans 2CP-C]